MDRRTFIQQSTALTAFTALGGITTLSSFMKNPVKHITILHTNDVHSHIDSFPANHRRNPNQGGVARRATAIAQIRNENPNTLLLDAGDIFQGTPYFNFYGGELEFRLMSMLKYDAATIGNHDFDNGIDGIYKQLPHASFPFICSNYDFTNTVMDEHTLPYKIFVKDGIKIGIYGVGIELKGLVDPRQYKETKYLPPIEIAQDMERLLKEEKKCDLVICLSHIGYNYRKNPNKVCDLQLAKATRNTDLIIGGHTHTFLKKPTVVKNAKDKNVLVNQVGCYGINLGRIDFYFDENNQKSSSGTTIIV
ncbi:MAG: metallophosphatase [Flavobacteriaceae bacterium]|nr:metallophosphatase [Flavobacteriaceae bacterium]